MTGFCVRRSALVSELRRAFYIMIFSSPKFAKLPITGPMRQTY